MVAIGIGRIQGHSFAKKYFFRVDRSNRQDSTDPISFDCVNVVEDWVRMKDMCLDDHGDTDWTALDSPSANTMLLGPPNDDADDLGAGNYMLLWM